MLPITEELPDSWIDDYWDGIKKPSSRNRSAGEKTSVKAELEVYSGAALDWFSLFDLFKVLVDNSNNTPGEKLAILKRNLKGNMTDIVYGLGRGEAAYKEALVHLKENCGRRVVMRAAHLQALDKLEPGKGTVWSIKMCEA